MYWEIMRDNVFRVVKAYFGGDTLPKLFTHTNLVLIPKKSIIQSFSDLKPIYLSNFINKVISKMMQEELTISYPL